MKPHNKYNFEDIKTRINLVDLMRSDGIEVIEANGKLRCNSFINPKDNEQRCYINHNDEFGKWFFYDWSIRDGGSVIDYYILMHYKDVEHKQAIHLACVDLAKILEEQESKGALTDV